MGILDKIVNFLPGKKTFILNGIALILPILSKLGWFPVEYAGTINAFVAANWEAIVAIFLAANTFLKTVSYNEGAIAKKVQLKEEGAKVMR